MVVTVKVVLYKGSCFGDAERDERGTSNRLRAELRIKYSVFVFLDLETSVTLTSSISGLQAYTRRLSGSSFGGGGCSVARTGAAVLGFYGCERLPLEMGREVDEGVEGAAEGEESSTEVGEEVEREEEEGKREDEDGEMTGEKGWMADGTG